jgi:hypothetical protein
MRRRLAIAAVAGVLALSALAGCRAEPGSAAFVGNTRITTAQVNDVVDGVKADGGKVDPADEGALRQTVATAMVFLEVAKRYAAEKGLPAPQVDYQSVASRNQLPEGDPLVKLVAESNAYLNLVLSNAPATTPTDADYNAAADLLATQGVQGDRAAIIEQLKSGFSQQIAQGVSIKNELTPIIQRENVSMNPLYGPTSLPLTFTQNRLVLTALPLTAGSSTPAAVVDINKPE